MQDLEHIRALTQRTARDFAARFLGVGVVVVGRDLTVVWMNPEAEKYLGEGRGRKCYELFHGREDPCPRCGAERIFAGGEDQWTGEVTLRGKGGGVRWFRFAQIPLRDEEGEIPALVVLLLPLTPGEEVERRWEEERLRYKLLLDHAPLHICLVDEAGRYLSWNRASEKLFGYSEEEALGKLSPRDLAKDREAFRKAAERVEREGSFEGELELVRKDGSSFPARILVGKSYDSAGTHNGYVVAAIDISQQKRWERELEEKNRELEGYASTVSHDLRTPLTLIRGYAEVLRERYGKLLDAGGREAVDRIVESGRFMNRLIDDLLTLSRVGSGEITVEEISPAFLVKQVLGNYERELEEWEAEVEIGPLPERIVYSPGMFYQIISNLVDNALRYTPAHVRPRLEIGSRRGEGEWIFFVKDNGPGIPPDKREEIFQPFTRLHGREEEKKGTGIGLAIVKRAVERGGGKIRVEDAPEGGSVFLFSIPDRSS